MAKKDRALNAAILVVSEIGDSRWGRLTSYLKRKGANIICTYSLKETYAVLRQMPVNVIIADYDQSHLQGSSFLKKTSLEATQCGVKILVLFYANAWHCSGIPLQT